MRQPMRGIAFLLLAGTLAGAIPPAQAVEDRYCRIGGAGGLAAAPPLGHTRVLLTTKAPLRIVAVGSSSTQGFGASDPSRAYPADLARLLEGRLPGQEISILNRGVGGDDILKMLARFPTDVLAEKPDLVIWQTGTNDAISGLPVDHFAQALARGLAELRAEGADVILMTPQYAPRFNAVAGAGAYLDAMRKTAAAAGVPLFDRYAPSKAWLADRHFADAPVLTIDGLHQSDAGYHCVAVLLAAFLTGQAGR